MIELPFHPMADLFPLMEGGAFDDLTGDIRSTGQCEDIVTLNGMILDGRNRYRACLAAAISPQLREFGCLSGDGDSALTFIISKNLRRRHLDESHRATVAARITTMRQGESTDLPPSATLPKVSQPQATELMNVSPAYCAPAKTVRDSGAPALVRAVEQGRRPNVARAIVKRSARHAREAALGAAQVAGNLTLPTERCGVIVAVPQWRFEPRSRNTGMDRAADNRYPTSAVETIMARDVVSIAAADCVLFLWATAPMLPQALSVMAAWRFEYKTHVIWHKLRRGSARGTGDWANGEHELLLIGTRGQIPAPATAMCASLIAAPWARHSTKPEVFSEIIERQFPSVPKIELNRRGAARPGWSAWGDEAQQTINPDVAPDLAVAGAPTPLPATSESDHDLPASQEYDARNTGNFVRIGHLDC